MATRVEDRNPRKARVSETKKTSKDKPKMVEITLSKPYIINEKIYKKGTVLLVESSGVYQDFGGHQYSTEFSSVYDKKALRKALAADENDSEKDTAEKKELRRLIKKYNLLPADPTPVPAEDVGQDALDHLAEEDEYEGSPEDEYEDMEGQEEFNEPEEDEFEEDRIMIRRAFPHKYLRKAVEKDDDLEEEEEDEKEKEDKKALRKPIRRAVKKDKELDEEDEDLEEEDEEDKEDKKPLRKNIRRPLRRFVKKDKELDEEDDEELEEEEDDEEKEDKKPLRRAIRRPLRRFVRKYNVVPGEEDLGQEAMDKVQESTRTRRSAPRIY